MEYVRPEDLIAPGVSHKIPMVSTCYQNFSGCTLGVAKDCGSTSCQLTCSNPSAGCSPYCADGCRCPFYLPYWDENGQKCTSKKSCGKYYLPLQEIIFVEIAIKAYTHCYHLNIYSVFTYITYG